MEKVFVREEVGNYGTGEVQAPRCKKGKVAVNLLYMLKSCNIFVNCQLTS
jgi:hypothetical protein